MNVQIRTIFDTDSAWLRHEAEIRELQAEAWEEGFNEGHYIPGEDTDCDCKKNPYRD